VTFPITLDGRAIMAARSLSIPPLAYPLYLKRGYWHWTVEGWVWSAPGYYNWIVGKLLGRSDCRFCLTRSTPAELNASDYPLPDGYAAHTYRRNDHAIGIGINALSDYPDGRHAGPTDFGPQPLEVPAVELMLALSARLCLEYTIDPAGKMPNDDPHAGEPTWMTHAEAAIADAYFPTQNPADGDTRWDLTRLEASPNPISTAEAVATGDLLRARLAAYYQVIA
jgi:hypothetical protein